MGASTWLLTNPALSGDHRSAGVFMRELNNENADRRLPAGPLSSG
ncbi:hypothetical protein [Microbacterium sp. CH12i]|nr:hypothetical protein [Microbacterium sp. CH12i]